MKRDYFNCSVPSGLYPRNAYGGTMAVKDDILEAMRKNGKPMSAGEVEKALGMDRKTVDAAFKELKADGSIVSPVRCKWEPK